MSGSPFVSVDPAASRFMLDGEPFYFFGSGHFNLGYVGSTCSPTSTCAAEQLDAMAAAGVKVVRVGVHGNCTFSHCMQTALGVYNDAALVQRDHVIAQAAQRGMKVILVLETNWNDGVDQLIYWVKGTVPSHEVFYTDGAVKAAYKASVANLVNRVNTETGLAYKDDPAIMSWELLDDARCTGNSSTAGACVSSTIATWATEMAAYVKSLDPKHLVGLGDEGFLNQPGGGSWTTDGSTGDFNAYTSIPNIDYGTFKWFPGNWSLQSSATAPWITSHVTVATAIGKPAVLTEYGWALQSERLALYTEWMALAETSGLAGDMLWNIQSNGYPDYDGFAVIYPDHQPVLAKALEHSQAMAAK